MSQYVPSISNPIYRAVGVCMQNPDLANIPDLKIASAFSQIESINHFKDIKAYIYQGSVDSVVNPKMAVKLKEFYTQNEIPLSQIKVVEKEGGHNFPTDKQGLNDCKAQEVPYISSCGFNLAEDLLSFVLSKNDLQRSEFKKENLYLVDQNLQATNKNLPEHKWTSPSKSLASYGYLYASNFCLQNPDQCQLHIALHGCEMSDSFDKKFDELFGKQVQKTLNLSMRNKKQILPFQKNYAFIEQRKLQYGTLKFAMNSGYAEYAEKNNLMILFPQTWITEDNYPYNPKGCWDWFGWTGSNYASKDGVEVSWLQKYIQAIYKNPQSYILNTRPHFEHVLKIK